MSRYHVGIMSDEEILDRAARGLPVYRPKHPVDIEQEPYEEFAAKRGPNTE